MQKEGIVRYQKLVWEEEQPGVTSRVWLGPELRPGKLTWAEQEPPCPAFTHLMGLTQQRSRDTGGWEWGSGTQVVCGQHFWGSMETNVVSGHQSLAFLTCPVSMAARTEPRELI